MSRDDSPGQEEPAISSSVPSLDDMLEVEEAGGAGQASLRRGDVLDNRYQIRRPIAIGGMSWVYRARHLVIGTRVAIKVLAPELRQSNEAVSRFLREATALTRLRGENVVRVFDVGTTTRGLPYMVMELLSGHDLSEMLGDNAILPEDEAVDIVLQACSALAEAHRIGIIHRDVKPGNLFLTAGPDGSRCVKLIDFGLSRIDLYETEPSEERARLTAPGMVMGSPGYMPPEQLVATANADTRADIYGLGAVLYRMLTGKAPYTAEAPQKLYGAAVRGPQPLRGLRPDAPQALEEILIRCLRKKPGERYADVAELADALAPYGPAGAADRARTIQRILHGTGPSIPAVPPSSRRVVSDAAAGAGRSARPQRARWSLISVAFVLVAIASAAVSAIVVTRARSGDAPALAPVPDPSAPPAPPPGVRALPPAVQPPTATGVTPSALPDAPHAPSATHGTTRGRPR